MLTGFNTDVEHDGITYHVQTEDRGGTGHLIESLIYVKGEILGSRRISYQNLLEAGAELSAVRALMERQHFTIVETIRRGRIGAVLDPAVAGEGDTTISRAPRFDDLPSRSASSPHSQRTLDEVIGDWLAEQEKLDQIHMHIEGGEDLQFGAAFRLVVTLSTVPEGRPVPGVPVVVRFLSTVHRPMELSRGESGAEGTVEFSGTVPEVEKGTGLVVVSLQHQGVRDERKFLVRR